MSDRVPWHWERDARTIHVGEYTARIEAVLYSAEFQGHNITVLLTDRSVYSELRHPSNPTPFGTVIEERVMFPWMPGLADEAELYKVQIRVELWWAQRIAERLAPEPPKTQKLIGYGAWDADETHVTLRDLVRTQTHLVRPYIPAIVTAVD